MAGVPTYFQSLSPVLSSYDWIDITSGTGYRRYYPAVTGDNVKFLSSRTLTSSTKYWKKSANISSSTPAVVIDLDFDIEMKSPATVEGMAFFNGTSRAWDTAGATSYFTITVYHVNTSSTETSLGSATSENASDYVRECLAIDCSRKHFAIGETLRLNVVLYGFNTATSNGKVDTFYDPTTNVTYSDGTRTVGTDMIFDCPFRVNL